MSEPLPNIGEQVAEDQRKKELEEGQRAFTSQKELTEMFFGKPDTPEGSFARNAWERLQDKQGYTLERDRVLLTMRQTAQRIFEAMKKRLKAQQKNKDETEKELMALDAYMRTTGVIGQAIKVRNNPYAAQHENEEQSAADRELMESEELAILSEFADRLGKLNVEELIDMVLEDQEFITMLVELHDFEGSTTSIGEAEGFAAVDGDRLDQDGKILSEDAKNEQRAAAVRIGKFEYNFDREGYPKVNPNFEKNLAHLRKFILGQWPSRTGKISNDRRMTEMTLWLEIVSSMDFVQKRAIVADFLQYETVATAKDFINACVLGGSMSVEDMTHMWNERNESDSPIKRQFKKLGENYDKELARTQEERDEVKQEFGDKVDRIENVYTENAANHFITFNNMVMGRVAELGLLTTGLNLVLEIADRIRRRTEPERNENMAEAVAKGIADAGKNPWFWFGVGEMAVGTNYVYPWMRSAILRPGEEEKEHMANYKEHKFLTENLQGHPELSEYFLDHYNEYVAIAGRNDRDEDRVPGQPERGSFDLYPGDVKITPEEAGKMGFGSVQEATAVIHRMFGICAKVFRQPNDIELAQFFKNETNGPELPDPHPVT